MRDALATIEHARRADLVDLGGNAVVLELGPPAPPDAIAALEAERGFPLPRELRSLLGRAATFEGLPMYVDFSGGFPFEYEPGFPAGLPIAADGFGNFWVADLTPQDVDTVPVFYAAHDPPVILFQSASVGDFLHELFRMFVRPHESAVDAVHDDRPFSVWSRNPGLVAQADALASDDAAIRAFASELDERFVLVDLREADVGMGFSWGRHGADTEVRRHGYERLFAYAKPVRGPGLLGRFRRR
ncbi:MAG TPA: SMI1/KNR4 family protein [Solirubrobacteraceae bacterium]|jgi:hypothetical protein